MSLSPKTLQIIRSDFLALLRHSTFRQGFPHSSDRRLFIDLQEMGGLMGEW